MINGMTQERYEHIRDNLHSLELDLVNGIILNRNCYSFSSKGYYRLRVGHKIIYQHQIFAVARWGERCLGMTVNHKNNVKTDNSWNNLELITNEENIKLRKKARHEVTPVKAVNAETGEIHVFDSQQEASKKLGLSQGCISVVLSGKRDHTKGWTFERKEITA